jgi:hypothetical protein
MHENVEIAMRKMRFFSIKNACITALAAGRLAWARSRYS